MNALAVWWWDAQGNPDPARRLLAAAALAAVLALAALAVRELVKG